jgi:hypothetical protein
VLDILDNPVYLGLIRMKGETYQGLHEPIRSEETWERIQTLRAARRSKSGGRGAQPRLHLLTKGMLRCVCGSAMAARSFPRRRGDSRPGDYYVCGRRGTKGPGACGMPSLRRALIDGPLLELFETHVLDVEATIAVIRGEAERQIAEARTRADASQLEVARLDASLARVRSDYVAGELTAGEWRQLRSDLETDRAAAEAEAERHEQRAGELAADADRLDAEEAFAAQITELRRLVAGRVAASSSVDAIRAALTTTFERFDLIETDDGYVAVPRLRLDRRLEVPRTPDELLLPARRVALTGENPRSGCGAVSPRPSSSGLASGSP